MPGLEDDPDKVKHNAMHHCAFEYESFSDLMSSYARMRDEGIVPAFSLDHGITTSLYYMEPDGNFVELTRRDPQHRLADFRQHGALSSPMSSTQPATLNAGAW